MVTSPANGAVSQNTALTLSWAANTNATQYDVVVALDAAMTNVVAGGTSMTNSFSVSGLNDETTYYWTVLPKNSACSGVMSLPSSFQTGQVTCNPVSSTNVPVAISASGTPTINSTLTIANGVSISDINITMNVTHTWINDLTATLISPAGTEVQLVAGPCTNAAINNIIATFDDSGVPVVCGNNPGISGTVQPVQSLGAFNGQNSAGVWTLRIADGFNQDGGSLNSWSLSICSAEPLAVAENQLIDFAIYPNPNNGNFNVQFTSVSESNVSIIVHDIRGRQIFTRSYENGGVINENVQLENIQSGMYLITILNRHKIHS
jgi:subtilisin-like proprotein convertase family protein